MLFGDSQDSSSHQAALKLPNILPSLDESLARCYTATAEFSVPHKMDWRVMVYSTYPHEIFKK